MAQLSNDCFAFGKELMRLDEAVQLLRERLPLIAGIETVDLLAADGRILAGPLVAPIDLPPFDNSAVDGYAVRHADLSQEGATRLAVLGRIAAGQSLEGMSAAIGAVRIFTGAPMPPHADTVFMQEDCQRLEGGDIVLPPGLAAGANRRCRGEDLARGELALAAGRLLSSEDIGLAAALGVTTLAVRRRLRVGVFSSGDEIQSPGEPLRPAALYDANRFLLQSLLARLSLDVVDLGILPDKRDTVSDALKAAASKHDLVITSGGVSAGEEDHVRVVLGRLGSLVFWRLAIKPGRPVMMGIAAGKPLIGLPGNPVALFVTFVAIVRPLIAALRGEIFRPAQPLPVRAGFHYRKKFGRREYVRVTLTRDLDGEVTAHKHPIEGAGVLTSLTRSHGLVELGETVRTIAPGDRVGFIDFGLIR
jgi:molybdopterin molybdotransferase